MHKARSAAPIWARGAVGERAPTSRSNGDRPETATGPTAGAAIHHRPKTTMPLAASPVAEVAIVLARHDGDLVGLEVRASATSNAGSGGSFGFDGIDAQIGEVTEQRPGVPAFAVGGRRRELAGLRKCR